MTATVKTGRVLLAALVVFSLLLGAFSVSVVAVSEADVSFTFTESGVTASKSGDGWTIEGSALTISKAGVYLIQGSSSEGSVKVAKNLTGVTLILSDLSLSSSSTAPLVIGKASEVTVKTSGTVVLTDLEDASAEDTSSDFEGAAVKVKSGATLTLAGDGRLTADGSACKNGIKGASEATVIIESGSATALAANNGIACDGELIIKGGTVAVEASEDGIKADPDDGDETSKGNLTITGGKITVTAGDDAIKAVSDLTVGTDGSLSGPEITVVSSTEALEGARIYLNSGSGVFHAKDDGINAATSRSASEIAVYVSGGDWYVDSEGDGVDAGGHSNLGGSIYMNGGRLVVFGSQSSGNGALDYDTEGKFSGGTLLAVGSSGMAQTLGGTGAVFSASVTKGAEIAVTDASGSVLVSCTAPRSANHVYFASDAVKEGDSLTLLINGSKAASATVGSTASGGGFGGGFGGRGQMGGGFGQRPEDGQNGSFSLPQAPADGEMPQGGFGGRGQMGVRPERSGERPSFDGTRPDMGGGFPFGGEAPSTEAPAVDEAPAEEEAANPFFAWFQSILDFFSNLFAQK